MTLPCDFFWLYVFYHRTAKDISQEKMERGVRYFTHGYHKNSRGPATLLGSNTGHEAYRLGLLGWLTFWG